MKGETDAINYKDWQLACGKSWKGLKLLSAARILGRDGYIAHLNKTLSKAQYFESLLKSDKRLQVLIRKFGFIVFFVKGKSNDENQRLLDSINSTGKIFLISTKLDGQFVLRISVGGLEIEDSRERIDFAFDVIKTKVDELFG